MITLRDVTEMPAWVAPDDFWSLVGDQETGTIDFKEQMPRPGKLQEPLVAFRQCSRRRGRDRSLEGSPSPSDRGPLEPR